MPTHYRQYGHPRYYRFAHRIVGVWRDRDGTELLRLQPLTARVHPATVRLSRGYAPLPKRHRAQACTLVDLASAVAA